MIDNAVYGILSAYAPLTGLVGTNVFSSVADQQDVNNYVVIHLIDISPENTKDGKSMLD